MPYDTRSPSSITNLDISGASNWQNMNNVSYADTMVASCTMDGFGSKYLGCTGFNFDIPQFSTINGVVLKIKRYANFANGGHSGKRIEDSVVKLIKNGTISGNNLYYTAIPLDSFWSTTLSYITFADNTNLWGLSLNPDDINSSDFGVAISVIGNLEDGSEIAYIDHLELIVYYTDGENTMDTDVITKIINNNDIRNGDSVVSTKVNGGYDKLQTQVNRVPSIDQVNVKYKDKFTGTDTYSN